MREQSATELLDQRIAARAAGQHDLIDTAQLRGLGATPDAIDWRRRRGRLHRQYRGVFSWASPDLSLRGRWMAAVLASGSRAGLSHRSGGMLREILRLGGGRIEVSVPGKGGRTARDRYDLHRVAIEPWEIETVDAIPCTIPARIVLDLSAGATPERIAKLITRLNKLELYDHAQLQAVLVAHPRHRGAARLARALDDYTEPEPVDSRLERLFLELVRRAALPTPSVQRPHGAHRLDFLWPQHDLIVEVDGWDTHGTRHAFEDDRARDAEHTAQGLRTLRFTYRPVTRNPDWVAGVLLRTLTNPARDAA